MENHTDETLALRFGLLQPNISQLEGKVLTIIEAALDGEKCEAVKSLVKEAFRVKLDWFFEVCHSDLERAKEVYPKYGRPFPEETVKI